MANTPSNLSRKEQQRLQQTSLTNSQGKKFSSSEKDSSRSRLSGSLDSLSVSSQLSTTSSFIPFVSNKLLFIRAGVSAALAKCLETHLSSLSFLPPTQISPPSFSSPREELDQKITEIDNGVVMGGERVLESVPCPFASSPSLTPCQSICMAVSSLSREDKCVSPLLQTSLPSSLLSLLLLLSSARPPPLLPSKWTLTCLINLSASRHLLSHCLLSSLENPLLPSLLNFLLYLRAMWVDLIQMPHTHLSAHHHSSTSISRSVSTKKPPSLPTLAPATHSSSSKTHDEDDDPDPEIAEPPGPPKPAPEEASILDLVCWALLSLGQLAGTELKSQIHSLPPIDLPSLKTQSTDDDRDQQQENEEDSPHPHTLHEMLTELSALAGTNRYNHHNLSHIQIISAAKRVQALLTLLK